MSANAQRLCSIVGCKNYSFAPSGIRSFFISKTHTELVRKWVKSIRTYMPDFPDDMSDHRICQLHFDTNDLKLYRGELQLRFGAIPKHFPRSEKKQMTALRRSVTINRKPSTTKVPLSISLKPKEGIMSANSKCTNCKMEKEMMQRKINALQDQIKKQQYEITMLHKRNQYLKTFEPDVPFMHDDDDDDDDKKSVYESKLTTDELCLQTNHTPDLGTHFEEKSKIKSTNNQNDVDLESEVPISKPFQCGFSDCNERFGSTTLLREHINENHVLMRPKEIMVTVELEKRNEKMSFECYVCRKTLATYVDTVRHMERHFELPRIGKPKAKCCVCWTNLYDGDVNEHLCEHIASANNGSIDCEYCSEKLTSISKLFKHVYAEHANDKTLYRCISNCSTTFPVKSLLEYHRSVHTQEIYKCNQCSTHRSFRTLSQLSVHIKRHQTEKKFLCEECGNAFQSNHNLNKHKLIHGPKLFQCTQCPFKTSTSILLKKHSNFHSKQTYSCHLCNVVCTTSYRLLIHIKRHTEPKEKRLECSMCSFKCSERNRLKRHLSTVHTTIRPWQCVHCPSKYYKHKGDLNKHLRTHLGDDMYACPEHGCSKRFRLQLDLQKHASEHYVEGKTMDTDN